MLMRFDPFRDLDRVAEELWSGRQRTVATMPMDAYRDGERFVVAFDLPGVDPDAIDVTVEKNVLTVSAERTADRSEDREWIVAERRQGRWNRQVFLGETLDPDGIEAHYEQGVLTLTIPVAEAAKPRKVAVNAGGSRSAIETSSSEAA